MTDRPEISVIIVNCNGRRHLDVCLQSVAAQRDVDFECMVVDNGSSDGSTDFVREHFPWVRVVAADVNLGFAEGNNLGARHAKGTFLAFLNNDTRAEAGWLASLRGALDGRPEVGLATSRIVYMHDPSVLDSAGDGLTRAGGAFKHGHGASASDYGGAREVFGACGAAFMIRRALFEALDGFDADFFASHEDVDLSYRARLYGYRCVYVPDALVQHAGSATLGRSSRISIFYGQRNLEWMLLKNTPGALVPPIFVLHVFYLVAALAYFASIGRVSTFIAAKWAAASGLPRAWRKRRGIQRSRRASAGEIWTALDSGWLAVKLREKRFDARIHGTS